MNVVLLLSSPCLIAGGLLLVLHVLCTRRPSLPVRLARARGEIPDTTGRSLTGAGLPESWSARAEQIHAGYEQRLRRAGRDESVRELMAKKLLFTLAAPLVPLLPYSVAVQHAPSPVLAVALAGRDCQGPLGQELSRALSLARRDRTLQEREALIVVAGETGEPTMIRFAELLAAKESPYGQFLGEQARQIRGEQNRWLERAADRAHIAMRAPRGA